MVSSGTWSCHFTIVDVHTCFLKRTRRCIVGVLVYLVGGLTLLDRISHCISVAVVSFPKGTRRLPRLSTIALKQIGGACA